MLGFSYLLLTKVQKRRLPSPIVPGMSSKKPPHKDDKDEDVVSSGSDTESESEEDEDTVSIT